MSENGGWLNAFLCLANGRECVTGLCLAFSWGKFPARSVFFICMASFVLSAFHEAHTYTPQCLQPVLVLFVRFEVWLVHASYHVLMCVLTHVSGAGRHQVLLLGNSCVAVAGGYQVLKGVQKGMNLPNAVMLPSFASLRDYGNTSCSTTWCGIKKGWNACGEKGGWSLHGVVSFPF